MASAIKGGKARLDQIAMQKKGKADILGGGKAAVAKPAKAKAMKKGSKKSMAY